MKRIYHAFLVFLAFMAVALFSVCGAAINAMADGGQSPYDSLPGTVTAHYVCKDSTIALAMQGITDGICPEADRLRTIDADPDFPVSISIAPSADSTNTLANWDYDIKFDPDQTKPNYITFHDAAEVYVIYQDMNYTVPANATNTMEYLTPDGWRDATDYSTITPFTTLHPSTPGQTMGGLEIKGTVPALFAGLNTDIKNPPDNSMEGLSRDQVISLCVEPVDKAHDVTADGRLTSEMPGLGYTAVDQRYGDMLNAPFVNAKVVGYNTTSPYQEVTRNIVACGFTVPTSAPHINRLVIGQISWNNGTSTCSAIPDALSVDGFPMDWLVCVDTTTDQQTNCPADLTSNDFQAPPGGMTFTDGTQPYDAGALWGGTTGIYLPVQADFIDDTFPRFYAVCRSYSFAFGANGNVEDAPVFLPNFVSGALFSETGPSTGPLTLLSLHSGSLFGGANPLMDDGNTPDDSVYDQPSDWTAWDEEYGGWKWVGFSNQNAWNAKELALDAFADICTVKYHAIWDEGAGYDAEGYAKDLTDFRCGMNALTESLTENGLAPYGSGGLDILGLVPQIFSYIIPVAWPNGTAWAVATNDDGQKMPVAVEGPGPVSGSYQEFAPAPAGYTRITPAFNMSFN